LLRVDFVSCAWIRIQIDM